jgi:uncharacterized protein YndB with AHSA1/START domain
MAFSWPRVRAPPLLEHRMDNHLVAHASTTVQAPIAAVWDALVNPAVIKQYMFGADVTSNWKEGSPIVWKGEWQGKPFEDRGVILHLRPNRLLSYSHFSPLEGKPDTPDNYHTVTVELSEQPGGTRISLSQDNNATEQTREHSEKNWNMMLAGMKKVVEQRS